MYHLNSFKLFLVLSLFSSYPVLWSQPFKEISNDVGINYQFPGNDLQEVGAGVTVLDVNNDGWDDIFQAGGVFPSKLWINQKGKFYDATEEFKLSKYNSLKVLGAAAADYDNDGFEDIFLANLGVMAGFGDKQNPVLLHNVEGKYFEAVFEATFNEIGDYSACIWGDINKDGFVDLYVLNYVHSMGHEEGDGDPENPYDYDPICLPNKLYINNQGNGFTEVSNELKLDDDGCGLAAVFSDYDNDLDPDLILLNDFGEYSKKGNRIFRNEYPSLKFTDVTDSLSFYREFFGMGVGPGDFNNDGWMDYYLTNIGRNYFFVNHEGSFTECASELGIESMQVKDGRTSTSWSGIFFDSDNDLDLDLFVSKGFLDSFVPELLLDPNSFYKNNGDGTFTDISSESRINDSLANRGAATLDYDHDGDLDVISGVIKMGRGDFAHLDQKIKLYENLQNKKNKWVAFKLSSENHDINQSCIGCRVIIELDTQTLIRDVDGGSGHSSQSSRIIHFGLGKRSRIKKIKIIWTNGDITSIDEKIKLNRAYKISVNGSIEKMY